MVVGLVVGGPLRRRFASDAQPGVVGGDWPTVWKVFTITNAADVLDNFATEYAGVGKAFAGQNFEIAGIDRVTFDLTASLADGERLFVRLNVAVAAQ